MTYVIIVTCSSGPITVVICRDRAVWRSISRGYFRSITVRVGAMPIPGGFDGLADVGVLRPPAEFGHDLGRIGVEFRRVAFTPRGR